MPDEVPLETARCHIGLNCVQILLVRIVEVRFETSGRFVQITLSNDIVAVKHRPSLVTGDRHCYALRNTCPYHVPYSSASKIVEQFSG